MLIHQHNPSSILVTYLSSFLDMFDISNLFLRKEQTFLCPSYEVERSAVPFQ